MRLQRQSAPGTLRRGAFGTTIGAPRLLEPHPNTLLLGASEPSRLAALLAFRLPSPPFSLPSSGSKCPPARRLRAVIRPRRCALDFLDASGKQDGQADRRRQESPLRIRRFRRFGVPAARRSSTVDLQLLLGRRSSSAPCARPATADRPRAPGNRSDTNATDSRSAVLARVGILQPGPTRSRRNVSTIVVRTSTMDRCGHVVSSFHHHELGKLLSCATPMCSCFSARWPVDGRHHAARFRVPRGGRAKPTHTPEP